ncbi:hypothetical protein BDV25DRAFT_142676 [Aspergillus avenaceus]|uniref:Uncharacterized protein n=1 Tax=Aspergillus avenaceus TaxID=36643 RepID=A0A5N6TMB8_ASPAV|nr:hypothetical protein BDV25DRAFT_142676 [Aspergillus avenaceus]
MPARRASYAPRPKSHVPKVDSWERRAYKVQVEDGHTTEDEEEVLYDLDEAAMSSLPLHLQNNMREIHFERVRRMHEKDSNTKHHIHSYHASFTGIWYRNTMAKRAASPKATYEGLVRPGFEPSDSQMTCNRHDAYEGVHTRYHRMVILDPYPWRSTAFLNLGNDLFPEQSPPPERDEDVPFSSYRQSISKSTPELSATTRARTYVPPVVESPQVHQMDNSKSYSRFRKTNPSIIYAMRGHLRRKLQKISRVFGK